MMKSSHHEFSESEDIYELSTIQKDSDAEYYIYLSSVLMKGSD